MFQLKIESTDNAAFEEPAEEVARILREAAAQVEDEGLNDRRHTRNLRDYNGNTVGFWAWKR